jgi:predicted nucleotide-binding protein (sugar kinase/HSP70/actin superfamily)
MPELATIQHYTGYKPRPFARAQRKDTTILYGGLTWKHERLIQGVMHNLHYNAQPLPNIAREDLDTGKELIDVGACCPTIFTTGNLVNFLKKEMSAHGESKVTDKFVFMTAGSCGPCRFGQYHQSYAMALDGLGLRDFRMFLLAQDELDQSKGDEGLEINPPLSLGLIWAILCGDLLTDLEYMTRPYEVVPGETNRVLRECVEYMYQAFRDRPLQKKNWQTFSWHLLSSYFVQALRKVREKWDAIEVDRLRVKTRVKITGEFWIQTHEGDGNYNIKRWLEQEGAEVIPPAVAVWLDYLFHPVIRELTDSQQVSRHPRLKRQALAAVEKTFRGLYNRFRKALANLPDELPDQIELKKLAAPFYHFELRGGEGHMLVGKALHSYHHHKAHMICELSPYSCMPNTMSVGAMANVLGKYPDLLYAPIEIKGDAEVHALSRCQMILTEAKKRAQDEFDAALRATGLTVQSVREYEKSHPEVRRATYRVPRLGYAGVPANYVAHLAQRGCVGHA